MKVQVSNHLCHHVSSFQTIDIVETDAFGKALLLDEHIQLTSLDEHAYHESLVHIPLMAMEKPTRALVVGGGDGGVLRELVKWDSIQHIDMVEIDHAVAECSQRWIPEVSDGAFNNPKVHLTIGDAFPFVKQNHEPYNLIIIDATDCYEDEKGEISEMLFTDEFYADCQRLVAPGGAVVTQADNLLFCPYSLESISANFKRTFAHVGSYWAMIPSFGGFSGYCWASDTRLNLQWRPGNLELQYLTATTWQLAQEKLSF